MKSFDGWLLMSDLDGTLLSNQKRISMENKEAIKSFVSCGGLFTIASGRTELTCRLATDFLPVNAPIVLYNGAAIYDLVSNDFLWTNTLNSEEFIPLLKGIVHEYETINIQVFQGGPLLLVNRFGQTDPYIVKENQQYRYAEWENIHPKIFKIMFRANHGVLLAIEHHLMDWGKDTGVAFESFFSADYYLEIVPPNCSKGTCLSWICEYLKIPMTKTLAIGDHANDIDMLRRAKYSAAPENAIDSVKQVAQRVVADCDHHSIHDFLHECGYI